MSSAQETSTREVFLTPVEARRLLGVSHRTLQRYRAAGVLTPAHYTPGGHGRFRRDDVVRLRDAPAAPCLTP